MHFGVKYVFRQLAKSPGFTFVSIAMLALAIGMSTSTFSVANRALLSSMPFPQQEQLVQIFNTSASSQMMPHSPGNFLDIRASASSYSHLAGIIPHDANVAEPGKPPEMLFGLTVTANFLPTLGIQPVLGRDFTPDESEPNKASVVIITNAYWQRQFASDKNVIGKTLRIGTNENTVVGVLPPDFDKTLIWSGCSFLVPFTIYPAHADQRKDKWINLVGRLKPTVALASAQAELNHLAARLDHDHPADNGLDGLYVTGLASSYVDSKTRQIYWLVVGLSGIVLVIACANLASVQLARSFGRSHEFAVRAALGATRAALIVPLLLESVVITAAGTLLGVLLARWSNDLITHYFNFAAGIPIDGRVILFASGASLISAIIFGLAPAWLASRVSTESALKDNARGSTSSRVSRRIKFTLIVSQFALAMVLISAALSFSLAARNFFKRDLGWQPAGLFSGTLNIPYERYKDDAKKMVLMRELLDKLGQIQGVKQASLVEMVPLNGWPRNKKIIVDGAPAVAEGQEPVAFSHAVDSGFASTLGLRLREGSFLPETPIEGNRPLIVINRTMAERYWPGQSSLGKRVKFTGQETWNEVIGVVEDTITPIGFSTPASRLQIYCGLYQEPGIWYNFVLKSPLVAEALIKPARSAIAQIDPDIMIQQIGGVPEIFESARSGNNLMIIMLGAFAFIGLLIAVLGLYGVMNEMTLQRTREIGIRLALGADYSSILKLIFRQGGRLIFMGIIIGLFGVYEVSLIYRQTMPELQLPGVGLQVGIGLVLSLVGLIACYFPAKRAGRTDPVIALRSE